jgi:gluconate 5-dehydrogenase
MRPVFELFSLEGKVALVTGGNSGIGGMMAETLAEAGAAVVLVARDVARLNRTRDAIALKGGRAAALSCDLRSREQLDRLLADAPKAFGPIDILVSAAGINPRPPLGQITRELYDEAIAINLDAPFLLGQQLGQQMAQRGWGRIINIGSMQSVKAFGNSGVYGVSKSGVAGVSRALAEALSAKGVTVNTIVPGFFPTPLAAAVFDDPARASAVAARTMVGRNGRMEDIRGATLFLASRASDYVTGQMLFVDGGFSVH